MVPIPIHTKGSVQNFFNRLEMEIVMYLMTLETIVGSAIKLLKIFKNVCEILGRDRREN